MLISIWLYRTSRLPVLYVFGKGLFDVEDFEKKFTAQFADVASTKGISQRVYCCSLYLLAIIILAFLFLVIVFYDVLYAHIVPQVEAQLHAYVNFFCRGCTEGL
jgi:hypothetical protein